MQDDAKTAFVVGRLVICQFWALAYGISMLQALLRTSDAANANAFALSAGSEGTP